MPEVNCDVTDHRSSGRYFVKVTHSALMLKLQFQLFYRLSVNLLFRKAIFCSTFCTDIVNNLNL